ncbi:MAG: hypothetical protein ACLTOV_06765 [Phocaeicola sp.]
MKVILQEKYSEQQFDIRSFSERFCHDINLFLGKKPEYISFKRPLYHEAKIKQELGYTISHLISFMVVEVLVITFEKSLLKGLIVISIYAIVLLLHTKNSLRITQRTDE